MGQHQYHRNAADTTWGTAYSTSRTYDLANNVKSQTYPSGRVGNYSYNTAGQLTNFSGNLGDGTTRTYVSSATYNPAGLKERESYGMTTPLYLKLHYNKRHQVVDLRLGTVNDEWNWNRGALISYYGTNAVNGWNPFADDTDNNGNVRRTVNYVPVDDAISNHVVPQLTDYTYDNLNRIGSYNETQYNGSSWAYNVAGQTFSYDRYGNRQITATLGGVNGYNPSYTASNNRIVGLTYDAVGNITNDGPKVMSYDAENHMVSATGGSYVYDGEGQRVKRTTSGQEWWYVYGLGGESVAEYLATVPGTVQKEYGYRSGQLLVVGESGNVRWLVTDHLGSTRMTADSTGSLAAMKRQDYLPFGEDLYVGIRRNGGNGQYGYEPPASTVRQKFTGKERDVETGLDYFDARYFSNTQGRFTSTDPLFIEMKRLPYPQAWNLYAHTRNNPLRYVDPDGLDIKVTCANGQLCDETVSNLNNRKDSQFKVELKDGKLAVVGKVDASKLSKSESTLYKAVTDTKNTAELRITAASAQIDFGQSALVAASGAKPEAGVNVVDAADVRQLNKVDPSLSGEVIAHEALEAYVSVAEGLKDVQKAHARANEFFGNVSISNYNSVNALGGNVYIGKAVYSFGRIGINVNVEKRFVTPIPQTELRTKWGSAGGGNIRVLPPK